ncbi:MAG: FAD-binding oxidoreductase [Gemmatimonadetes bacterium]|nr:FAD-binding oxidoreductase [Gemmatimonadota bacterium]
METTDVVVIGAGIVGASAALRLAERGLDVVVLEREGAPAMGSTGKSAAGVRVQFTTAANVGLSMASLPVFRDFEQDHGVDIGYRDIGYLLLVPEGRWEEHLASVALQRGLGAPVEVLTVDEARNYTELDPTGLAGATFGPWDGVVDPHMVTGAWVAQGRALGVGYRFGEPVTALERGKGGWSVRTSGASIACGAVVNATGAWSGQTAAMAGLDLPVRPKRIQIFLSAPRPEAKPVPMTIDTGSGVYVRSEGDRVLFGLDNLSEGFGFSEGIEREWLEHVLLTGVRRFPWWEELGVDWKGSWWGYYGVTPDNSPVIGRHPGETDWVDACGFSGHGIMHAPATGVAVAEIVVDGAAHSVDVSAFEHDRFGEGTGPVETNVF